jgi:hypothetical protein
MQPQAKLTKYLVYRVNKPESCVNKPESCVNKQETCVNKPESYVSKAESCENRTSKLTDILPENVKI